MFKKISISIFLLASFSSYSELTSAATVYVAGTAPTDANLTFGNHLVAGDAHPSVPGVGGGNINNNGDVLNGQRTYIYDRSGAVDLGDGIANRGDADFAMLIWDMGLAFDSMRLYTHQDHYGGGPITDPFVAQDVMEYSVWGSNDGDNFLLLSDVTGFDIIGGGAGLPTYTFGGTEPTIVYRGGSAENGILNAYTREYVFAAAYQYYGIRASTISILANDSDPEIDAIAGFNAIDRCEIDPNDPSCIIPAVPIPAAVWLFGTALIGLVGFGKRRKAA
ncbi:MAG: VPLPA-CTERM sorting domain-containing protein [Gammaproteobacteria bacterium]|nr:VPLPA-CTERM sorting domain-containing protein [Gammaproteobacteria bacterium]MDH3537083.1 VPLPA-CTERM sorting domain-containing protein [Gammaproteobacteria bacterium]